MNDQRKVIYEQRAEIMDADHVSDVVEDFRAETIDGLVMASCPEGTYPEQWDVEGLKENVREVLDLDPPFDDWLQEEEVEQEIIIERLQQLADAKMAAKIETVERDRWVQVEKNLLIQTLDHHWKEHLATLDALRQVIHLRSYAQKKPIDEYKQEAFLLFERLLVAIREDVTRAAAARPGPDRGAGADADDAGRRLRAAGLHHPPHRPAVGRRRHGRLRCRRERCCRTCRRCRRRGRRCRSRPPTARRSSRRPAATRHVRAVRAASTSIATARRADGQAGALEGALPDPALRRELEPAVAERRDAPSVTPR